MKFIFVVQGEGRGHMTQAIALQNMIEAHGHEVCAVLVGKSLRREIPSFFYEHIHSDIIPFESPNFVTDKDNKSIKIRRTIINNLVKTRGFYKNLKKIDSIVKEKKPDVFVNFYDFLGGLYFQLFNPGIPLVCVGHQYLLEHPEFEFPKKTKKSEKFWYFVNTAITSYGASKKLALSFRKMPDCPGKNIYVVPPLLRKEVLEIVPEQSNYLLVYMVNAGFSEDIITWHKKNLETSVQIFCDRNDIEDGTALDGNLTFNRLNDQKFLKMMKNCSGYASTAGFESICEAMYLGKPVMMIPPEGHFEQSCNALDAELAGAGIQSKEFNLSKLLAYIPKHKNTNSETFKNWVNSAESFFAQHLFVQGKGK
jgi:uncharacterized protein (TIGR00661 family)